MLCAALHEYDTIQGRRLLRSRSERVHADVRWRRYLVAELVAKIDAR